VKNWNPACTASKALFDGFGKQIVREKMRGIIKKSFENFFEKRTTMLLYG